MNCALLYSHYLSLGLLKMASPPGFDDYLFNVWNRDIERISINGPAAVDALPRAWSRVFNHLGKREDVDFAQLVEEVSAADANF